MLPKKVIFATLANRTTGAGHIRRLVEISRQLPESIEKFIFGTIEIVWVQEFVDRLFLELDPQECFSEDTLVILDSYDKAFCLLVDSRFPNSKIIQIADRFTFLLPRANLIFLDLPFEYPNESIKLREIGNGIEYLPIRRFEKGERRFLERAERVLITTGGQVNENIFNLIIKELISSRYKDIKFDFIGIPNSHNISLRNVEFHELGKTFDDIAAMCDTSISAAGTTMWDLLANKIIVGLVAVVENQKANLDFAVQSDQAVEIIDYQNLNFNTDLFQSLLFDKDLRYKLFKNISGKYDFLGAKRIGELILQLL